MTLRSGATVSHPARLPRPNGCSVPSSAQKRSSPVYLQSPHLSVAEIEPTYLIYPSDVGDRARPHISYHQDNWSDLLPCMDWAQAILPHETTGLSPYEIEFGHQPTYHWDWAERTKSSPTIREQMSREEAQSYTKTRHEAIKAATEIAQRGIAQAQQ